MEVERRQGGVEEKRGKSEEENGGFLKTKLNFGAATQREGSEERGVCEGKWPAVGRKAQKERLSVREMQNRGRRFYHLAHLY